MKIKNKIDKQANTNDSNPEMGFLDHLEDLRKRIIWALLGIIVGCILAGIFINQIMDYFLLAPAKLSNISLQNLKPFGQPFLYFKVVLVVGLIISFPNILLQLWLFVAPGLYQKEKKYVGRITVFTSFCFLAGVAFAYYLMIPTMLNFAATFGSASIKNIIDVNEYFSFITIMLLACGLVFEMPMLSYILSKFGIINSKLLSKYRRHSILINLILAAILTPSTDPISQLIFAIPLFILYEISIIVSRFSSKKTNENE